VPVELDGLLDKRPVRAILQTIEMAWRYNKSELA
jgi:hypothetical protein